MNDVKYLLVGAYVNQTVYMCMWCMWGRRGGGGEYKVIQIPVLLLGLHLRHQVAVAPLANRSQHHCHPLKTIKRIEQNITFFKK